MAADKIVEFKLIVGHSSTRLNGHHDNGHTHQWTLFVKPANKEYEEFVDNKIIQKVKFQIHESFPNPIRNISKPPFKISETGFASFSTYVTIYLNLPHQKPHTIPYELNLFTGEHDVQEDVQKLVIRGESVPTQFLEQVKKYCRTKKRKASMAPPEKSPEPKKHKSERQKQEKVEKVEKAERSEKSSKASKKSAPEKDPTPEPPAPIIPKIEITSEKDEKKKKKAPKTAEELSRRLKECTDPYVIYKASEFLLSLPNTTLSSSTLRLSFDLSKSSPETLQEVYRILKSGKKVTTKS